jgi:pimeloyl-ACP methyl ester carboxylesterase
LLGAFAGYRHNPAVVELAAVVGQLEDPVDRAFIRDFQLATLERPIPDEQLARVISKSQALPARVWKAILDELMSPNGELPLREVQVPALLLWGARDAFVTRADQERLLRDIAGARLVEYPDGGHAFHWEDPRPTAIELHAFAEACFGRA